MGPARLGRGLPQGRRVLGCLRAGARGYLLKDVPREELVPAIHRVAAGETVLGGPAAERLVATLNEPAPSVAAPEVLSEREREVARLVGGGATNREVSRRLFITEGTAKNHVTGILRKLELRDRTALALWVGRLRG